MAILDIVRFPDARLRKKAAPVEHVDDSIRTLVEDMLETMYDAYGIGLAATQVDVQKAVLVADVDRKRSEKRKAPICLINPKIVDKQGKTEFEEGCLSIPGCSAMVQRAERIVVDALDADGDEFTLDADGLLAICVQHEIDHLQGKLFIDHLSPIKRTRVIEKMRKAQAQRSESATAVSV